MKTLILAGGMGTRLGEETKLIPKPMVEIGGYPILWHIMKIYSHYGYNDFIICAGYKQHMIKEFFSNYLLKNSDVTFDFQGKNKLLVHSNHSENWKVTVVDTGIGTLTGGRLLKIKNYLEGEDNFMLTYGDGVSDVDINSLVNFHKSHGRICTVTATKPESRFGFIDLEGNQVNSFREKSQSDVGYINSGFMVLKSDVFDYIDGDVYFEEQPLQNLTRDKQVMAYKHNGFWQCMDTLRDKRRLETLWEDNKAPWALWKNEVKF